MNGWMKLAPPPRPVRPRCDLCERIAVWSHPLGGKRCGKCPKPRAAVGFTAPVQPEERLAKVVKALEYAIVNGLQHWSHTFTDVECPRCKADAALVAAQPKEHVVCEGSRQHVVSWNSNGARCSEPRCEINHTAQPEEKP